MEVSIVCPLGAECETSTNGGIKRCAWYVDIEGLDSNTGDKIKDSRCAMAWMPLLQIETTSKTIGVNEAICSAKEENIKRQDIALNLELQRFKQSKIDNTLLEIL